MTHYVPEPTFRQYAAKKLKALVAACGHVLMPGEIFAMKPRNVDCQDCKRSMLSEETAP